MSPQKYRILSLDGGGSWSLIQVRALQEIYGIDFKGRDLLAKFDLVTANSGGSIVAAALIEDYTLAQILDIYEENNIKKVFVKLPWYKKLHPLQLFGIGPRYSTSDKLNGLESFFTSVRDEKIHDIPQLISQNPGTKTHFLFTGFDYDRKRAVFFRSNKDSLSGSFSSHKNVKLLEAIHASSNAPINFFDKPAEINDTPFNRRYWDGAIGAYNNPVLAAVTEALSNKIDPQDIEVLSIGTGSIFLPLKGAKKYPELVQEIEQATLINDLKKLATSIMDDPPDAASFISYVALRQKLPASLNEIPVNDGSLVRLNPLVQPVKNNGEWDLPNNGLNIGEFQQLLNIDMDAIKQSEIDLISTFCEKWIVNNVPNQPIRTNSDLECEIGHNQFIEARDQWLQMAP